MVTVMVTVRVTVSSMTVPRVLLMSVHLALTLLLLTEIPMYLARLLLLLKVIPMLDRCQDLPTLHPHSRYDYRRPLLQN